jgi:hypothetical protein
VVPQQLLAAALQQVQQGQQAHSILRAKSAPNLAGLAGKAAPSRGGSAVPHAAASARLPSVKEPGYNSQLLMLPGEAPPAAAAAVQPAAVQAAAGQSCSQQAGVQAAAGIAPESCSGAVSSTGSSDCDILVLDRQGLAQAFESQAASAAASQLASSMQLCAVLEEDGVPVNSAGAATSQRPMTAGEAGHSSSTHLATCSSSCAGRPLPANHTGPPAAAGPAPVCSASRAPRLRRFSTESGVHGSLLQQQQLALLRQQQAQHSELAVDGLVLHDVAAVEASGGGAAAAAAAAALATAVWNQGRPPRGRRLSALSMVSNMSVLSSSVSECTLEDEGGEAAAVAWCSSAGVVSQGPAGAGSHGKVASDEVRGRLT